MWKKETPVDAAPVVLRDPASRFLSVGCEVPEDANAHLRMTERDLALALANYRAARLGERWDRGWYDLTEQERWNFRAFGRYAAYVLWERRA